MEEKAAPQQVKKQDSELSQQDINNEYNQTCAEIGDCDVKMLQLDQFKRAKHVRVGQLADLARAMATKNAKKEETDVQAAPQENSAPDNAQPV